MSNSQIPSGKHSFGQRQLSRARILWAITANDLLAAIKNKNVLTAFIAALATVLLFRFLPNLTSGVEPQYLLVYDAGGSSLVPLLETSQAVKVYTYPSEDRLKHFLANGDVPELGLVVPTGFDQSLETDQALSLQGYVMNWVSPADTVKQKQLVEAEISRLTGRPVEIRVDGNVVFPRPESHGLSVTLGVCLVYALLMTILPILPHLFLEEKQARTLDALLVSPASAGQIVAGKAITGLLYCLLAAAVVLVVFENAIVHWWLVALAILCGALLTTALGLWLGMRIQNRGQLSLALSLLIIPLLIPIFLSLIEGILPSWLIQLFRVIPSTALFNVFRTSAAGSIPWGTTFLSLAWVLAWAAGILALVSRQVRRLDRQAEGHSSQDVAQADRQNPDQTGWAGWARLSRFLPWNLAQSRRERYVPVAASLPVQALVPSGNADLAISTSVGVYRPLSGWKMTRIIAAKDIREATRNKIFISILLGTVVMAGVNIFLPRLFLGQGKPTYIVYDPGRSNILRGWAEDHDLRLNIVETRQDMENLVAGGAGPSIGLVIPADFDQKLSSGQEVVLDGYLSHTTDASKALTWATLFEDQFNQAGLGRLRIQLFGNLLYPSLNTFSQPFMLVIILPIIIFTLGAALVPLLLLEEKESHTLDALLVSPATLVQVVAGKGLAGALYCLLAAAILMGLNQRLFVHWEVALLAVLLTTFFAVSVGLVIGILSNNPTTAGTWGSLLLVVFIGLTLLGLVELPGWPSLVKQALAWSPGPTVFSLFRLSMAGQAPLGMVWANAGALLAAALVLYGLVLWRLSRADR